MIGSLGPIIFNASSTRKQTFEGLNRENSNRIATHENLNNKPILEFIGPGLDKVTLNLTWSIEHNLNPDVELQKLRDIRDKGEVVSFILGNKPYGSGKYLLENIGEEQKRIDNKGNIFSITFSLTLNEYIENVEKVTKIVPKPKPKPISTKTTTKKVTKKKTVKKTNTTKNKSITKKNVTESLVVKKKYDPLEKVSYSHLFLRKSNNKRTEGAGKR